MIKKLTVAVALCAGVALAQVPFDIKILDKIGKNAKESANVTLDANTIQMGAKLLGDGNDAEAKKTKEALNGLQGVFVRSFEFEKEGQYDKADLKPIRDYFDAQGWSKIVDVKDKKEESTIYLNTSGGKMSGFAILAAEPKEVTLVYISGTVSLDKLGALKGKMGIPDMNLSNMGSKDKPKKEDDEEK